MSASRPIGAEAPLRFRTYAMRSSQRNTGDATRLTALLPLLLAATLPSAQAAEPAAEQSAEQAAGKSTGTRSAWVEMARSGEWRQLTYEEIDDLPMVEGDIVLPLGQASTQDTRGFGRASLGARWAHGVVPYEFDASLSDGATTRALAAMAHWADNTGLRFVARNPDNAADHPDYLHFVGGNRCSSYVGRTGGAQRLWLASFCSTGNAIHEIGHAIGLYHEHIRPDRDSYIQIHWENVRDDKAHNFRQRLYDGLELGEYDHGSIMHYGAYYFSKNGAPTISAVQPANASFGQRGALSAGDIAAANRLYGTDLAISVSAAPSSLTPGDSIDVHARVTNLGEIDSGDLGLRIPIPAGASLRDSSGSGWLCIDTGELYCGLENLAAGASSQLVAVLSAPDLAGDLDIYAAIESTAHDYLPENDIDRDAVAIDGAQRSAVVPPDQRFDIDAYSAPGALVGTVAASGPDGGAAGDFEIVSGNDAGDFAIDPASGKLSVASLGPLADSYALGITAGSGAQRAPVALVQIVVTQTRASSALTANDGGGPLGPLVLLGLLATALASPRRR